MAKIRRKVGEAIRIGEGDETIVVVVSEILSRRRAVLEIQAPQGVAIVRVDPKERTQDDENSI